MHSVHPFHPVQEGPSGDAGVDGSHYLAALGRDADRCALGAMYKLISMVDDDLLAWWKSDILLWCAICVFGMIASAQSTTHQVPPIARSQGRARRGRRWRWGLPSGTADGDGGDNEGAQPGDHVSRGTGEGDGCGVGMSAAAQARVMGGVGRLCCRETVVAKARVMGAGWE